MKKICMAYLGLWLAAILIKKIFFVSSGIDLENSQILATPSWPHIFGTDTLGRDLFMRILDGGFISMVVGIVSSVLSLALACAVGILWTWYKPKNFFVLLVMDLLQALPSYVVSSLTFILLQGLFVASPFGTILALASALAVTHWMNPARILRAQTLQLKTSSFVEAARALGGSPVHILKQHVPAHLKNTLLVLWALQIPILLMYESFMSFIGLGVEAPYTSWGLLLQDGWKYLLDFPHLLLGPGIVLFTVLMALNYVLDSYRYSGMPEGKIEPPKADSSAIATEMLR